MLRVYLDSCAIQRPLDNRQQVRIALEAEAILALLGLVELGKIEIVSSEALNLETERIGSTIRRIHAQAVLYQAALFVEVSDAVVRRARHFMDYGIQPMDALHLASAEEAGCDYLCTCDDRFVKRANSISHLRISVASPLTLIEELGL